MGASVSLTSSTLQVEPGGTVTTDLRVRNGGSVVDQFSFQPLGDAAAWITVDPPSVRLFPDTDEVVRVTIAPPRAWNTPPGPATWAVKSVPQEDPNGAAVAEGVVDVGRFVDVAAELQPIAGRGRRSGRFDIAVDNHGNEGVPVRVTGADPEQALAFECRPAEIDGQPGAASFAKLVVRPATTIWRGQPRSHPFQVVVEPQARAEDEQARPAAPIVLNATYLQEPIIPKWLPKALLVLLALLLLLFVLWRTLVKPRVESAAREVAIEEIAPVASAVEALQPAVEEATQQAAAAEEQAVAAEEQAAAAQEQAEAAAAGGGDDGGGDDGAGGGGGGGLPSVFNETTEPSNFRIEVSAAPGANGASVGPTVPDDAAFALTDMILQNPGGDIGRIRVLIDDAVVLESALENFRDLDFHFVSPYLVGSGGAITVELECASEQIVAGDGCEDAVSFAGFTTTVTAEG
jgi:hypothetical protein